MQFMLAYGSINDVCFFNLGITEKFWNSKKDFLDNGFGFIVLNNLNKPVSICYAACIANNEAEIDVATLNDFQQKGLAKVAVSAFVEHCVNNKIGANWDCFEDNTGSLRTALSLNFKKITDYSLLSIYEK